MQGFISVTDKEDLKVILVSVSNIHSIVDKDGEVFLSTGVTLDGENIGFYTVEDLETISHKLKLQNCSII